jgi:hypothetical protein
MGNLARTLLEKSAPVEGRTREEAREGRRGNGRGREGKGKEGGREGGTGPEPPRILADRRPWRSAFAMFAPNLRILATPRTAGCL